MANSFDGEGLLAAWLRGERDAGRALFDGTYPRLARFFRNKVASPGDEADLVQRTMTRLLDRDRSSAPREFWPYVYGIARNVLREFARERVRRDRDIVCFDQVCARDLDRGPSSVIAAKREVRALLEGLRDLPLADQVVLELRFFEQLTAREIAETLALPRGSVHRTLEHGLARLRASVEERLRAGGTSEPGPSEAQIEQWAADTRRQWGARQRSGETRTADHGG